MEGSQKYTASRAERGCGDTSRGFSWPEGVRDFELLETCRAPAPRVIMRMTSEYQYPAQKFKMI